MSIIELRAEVERLCDLVINHVSKEDAENYYLSTMSPANFCDGQVNILKCNDEDKMTQAEAHELGHIYIREKGIVGIETEEEGPMKYLILELNNAISHRFVIKALLQEFEISSKIHLDLRSHSLTSVSKDIEALIDEVEILHGIGLKLYDISITIPDLKVETEKLARKNNEVYKAYRVSGVYLSRIESDTSRSEQEELINMLFLELGYENLLINYF